MTGRLLKVKIFPRLYFPQRFAFCQIRLIPSFLSYYFPHYPCPFHFPSFSNSCQKLRIFKENTFHVPLVSLQYKYNTLTFWVSEVDRQNYRGLEHIRRSQLRGFKRKCISREFLYEMRQKGGGSIESLVLNSERRNAPDIPQSTSFCLYSFPYSISSYYRYCFLWRRTNAVALWPFLPLARVSISMGCPAWERSKHAFSDIGTSQGRIKLFGAPRQWKHFRPLFQTVFLSGGQYYPPQTESNTKPPDPKTEITNILFYILNFCINNKI